MPVGPYAQSAELADLGTDLATVIAATDTLEASATTLIAATDTLEASAIAAAASLATIEGYTDSLEASAATIAAAVDTEIPAIATAVQTTIPALIGTPNVTLAADIAAVKVDTGTTLVGKIDTIDGIVDAILVLAGWIQRPLANTKTIDSNGGVATLYTSTNGTDVYAILVYLDEAPDAGLTSLQVTIGDLGTENVVVSHASATAVLLTALSKQSGGTGFWHLRNGDLVKVTAIGSGAGNTDIRTVAMWAPAEATGSLAAS